MISLISFELKERNINLISEIFTQATDLIKVIMIIEPLSDTELLGVASNSPNKWVKIEALRKIKNPSLLKKKSFYKLYQGLFDALSVEECWENILKFILDQRIELNYCVLGNWYLKKDRINILKMIDIVYLKDLGRSSESDDKLYQLLFRKIYRCDEFAEYILQKENERILQSSEGFSLGGMTNIIIGILCQRPLNMGTIDQSILELRESKNKWFESEIEYNTFIKKNLFILFLYGFKCTIDESELNSEIKAEIIALKEKYRHLFDPNSQEIQIFDYHYKN